MLNDHEQQTWRQIQRRLVKDPRFARSENIAEERVRGRARPTTVLVAAALATLLLAGPTRLAANELAERRRAPSPRRSSAYADDRARLDEATGSGTVHPLEISIPRPRRFTA